MTAADGRNLTPTIAPELFERAVAEVAQSIRELHRKHGLRYIVEVGRLLTQRFFDGDASLVHSKSKKQQSLRALAQQPNMPLSLSQLSRAVAIFEVLEGLGTVDSWQHLSMSHVRAVLALPTSAQRELLEQAEREGWTVMRLQEQARSLAPVKRGGGRPRLPRFVKSVHALKRYVDDGDSLFGDQEAIANLPPEEAERLYETVSGLMARCESLQQSLAASGRVPGV